MNITFGVCTTLDDHSRLDAVLSNIRKLPNAIGSEIIVAGPNSGKWITHKKNMIAKAAQNDVIVFLHDYYLFDSRWYQAYEQFGYDWDVCSNPQFLMSGQRHFTDWVLWDHPFNSRYTSVEYTNHDLTKFQYISGGFFLAKKQFILDNPFNENMPVGSAEDVEWSLRIRDTAKIACNPTALVIHNKKHRDWGRVGFPFTQSTHSDIATYKRMIGYDE